MYDVIPTIRYMGTKSKLLGFIIPEIEMITPENGTVCDIMAGSNSISYALKRKYKLITNDVQEFSYIISKALIENQRQNISSETAKNDLELDYRFNLD